MAPSLRRQCACVYGQTLFSMSLVMTSVILLTAVATLMNYGVYFLELRILRSRRRQS